jgi:hypothetical protein
MSSLRLCGGASLWPIGNARSRPAEGKSRPWRTAPGQMLVTSNRVGNDGAGGAENGGNLRRAHIEQVVATRRAVPTTDRAAVQAARCSAKRPTIDRRALGTRVPKLQVPYPSHLEIPLLARYRERWQRVKAGAQESPAVLTHCRRGFPTKGWPPAREWESAQEAGHNDNVVNGISFRAARKISALGMRPPANRV